MGSQTPHYVRGGCKKNIFDLSWSLAPKLALGGAAYTAIKVYENECIKSH